LLAKVNIQATMVDKFIDIYNIGSYNSEVGEK